jgi:hypothetical protein
MDLSEKALTQARDTVASLLEQLGLGAYLFEVEPRADHWEVRVECTPDSDAQGRASTAQGRKPGAAGWQTSVLSVDEDRLAACRTDARARDELLAQWRKRLTS